MAKLQLGFQLSGCCTVKSESLETILHYALKNVNAGFSRAAASLAGCVQGLGVGGQSCVQTMRYDLNLWSCGKALCLCLICEIFEGWLKALQWGTK